VEEIEDLVTVLTLEDVDDATGGGSASDSRLSRIQAAFNFVRDTAVWATTVRSAVAERFARANREALGGVLRHD